MSRLAARMAASGWTPTGGESEWTRDAHGEGAVQHSGELLRIMKLPRRVIDLATVEDLSPIFVHTDYCDGIRCGGLCDPEAERPARLRPIQSAALWEMDLANGFFGPMGVGSGKELTSMLAHVATGAERTVILSGADLRDQFFADYERYAIHFKLPELLGPEEQGNGVTFVAYSELSSARTADILERINPDLVFANEADALRHKTSARTKRFLRFMKGHPGARLCVVSGTITKESLKDYAHLIELALGDGAPLPSTKAHHVLADWCRAIDAAKGTDDPAPPGALLKLCTDEEIAEARTAGETPTELVRRAFRRRLVETRGVIASDESAIDLPLIINCRQLEVPERVDKFLDELNRTWAIPDGDEIDSPLELARVARQASCGFFYVWDWPGGVVDEEWREARKRWHRAVAHILRYCAGPGLDQPLLVARAAALGKRLAGDANAAWEEWCLHKHKRPPPTKAIWLDDFLVEDAAEWAERHGEGIIWYSHTALGEAIAARLGLPLYEGGTSAELLEAIARQERNASANPVIVVSVGSHYKGKNMQRAWNRCLYTSPSASGTTWEQSLGRIHRPGQRRPEVLVDVNTHTDWLARAVLSALNEARYQHSTTNPQKLIGAQIFGLTET